MNSSQKIAILVLSCDKYQSLWRLFFKRIHYFWPDCKYPLYLVTNHLTYDDNNVHTLKVGEDVDWTSNLLKALSFIEEDIILMLIEDAPLDAPVDSLRIDCLIDLFVKNSMCKLNLNNSLESKKDVGLFREVPPGAIYRTSLVPCLWRKKVLESLLKRGESAWDFEILGSKRSNKYPGFYTLNKSHLSLLHIIIKGRIERRAFNTLSKTNEIDEINFPVMTHLQYFTYQCVRFRSFIFNTYLPSHLRLKLRILLHK
jgi:hypothetical protein